jgi:hypothetical protein
MAGPVRSHRRVSSLGVTLIALGLFGGLVLVLTVVQVGLMAVNDLFGFPGAPVLFGGLLAYPAARHLLRARRARRAARELEHWEQTAGWEPAAWRWPWQPLVRWPETVTVLRAYRKGDVRVGELVFDDNGLGATVDRRAGRAAFAIVTLPQPRPSMSVRVRRGNSDRRNGEEAFEHRFHPVGLTDVSPALRAAHLADEIPPWTVVADELFVFVPLDGPLRPHDFEETARKARLVVSHLDR